MSTCRLTALLCLGSWSIGSRRVAPVRGILVRGLLAAGALVVMAMLPSSASALSNYTWRGVTAAGTAGGSHWSSPGNWAGAAPPAGAMGTAGFPALTTPACASSPRTATCYSSTNDMAGLSVNTLTLDDGMPYNITGNLIALGAGGL